MSAFFGNLARAELHFCSNSIFFLLWRWRVEAVQPILRGSSEAIMVWSQGNEFISAQHYALSLLHLFSPLNVRHSNVFSWAVVGESA